MPAQNQVEAIYVNAKDLPVYCPGPKAPRWSMHPRVFLDVTKTGEATCPYCGAHYVLQAETAPQTSPDAEPTATELATADTETAV
ncbi:hypothetical protein AAEX37_00441 [Oligella sp. MSHR50489EDL]|uniref:zinc-finger domain-containing protein n=1 Tax=Oligella sp. MSHR50489EDL TaxID=3139409 RepID=UPI003D8184FA